MPKREARMAYRVVRDIVIPAGTWVFVGDWTSRRTACASALISLGKDSTGEFLMPIEDALALGLVEEVRDAG